MCSPRRSVARLPGNKRIIDLLGKLMTKSALIILAALSGLVSQSPAHAAEGVASFNSWTVWTDVSEGQKICYISSNPRQIAPTNVRRGDIHFIVTIRPQNRSDVSTILGYPIHEQNANASADVDGRIFELTTQSEFAWLANQEQEQEFVNAIRAGMTLTVKATSQRGTNTVDTYSLRGVTAAHDRAIRECPVG